MDYGAILLDLDDTLYPYPECNEAGKRAAWTRARELGYDLDLVVTSEETGREKPGSVMFTLPLARLDRRPSEAVMVGNSVANDVVGGNAAGLTTVLFNCDEGGLSDHRHPDHRIEQLEELQEVVL